VILAFLLLAYSECHELFNHETLQSIYGVCSSATGNKADFLYSAFADFKMLKFNSSKLILNIVKMALSYIWQKAKAVVVLVGMLFAATRDRMAPNHGYRQLFASDSIWSVPGAYGRTSPNIGMDITHGHCSMAYNL
jgi:hypothetical protein